MKSLYECILESILSSTGAGMFKFSEDDVEAIYDTIRVSKHFDIDKMKKDFGKLKLQELFAKALCAYEFTKKDAQIIMKPGFSADDGLNNVMKKVFEPYILDKSMVQFSSFGYGRDDSKNLLKVRCYTEKTAGTAYDLLTYKLYKI